jgi:hypothetical protein
VICKARSVNSRSNNNHVSSFTHVAETLPMRPRHAAHINANKK